MSARRAGRDREDPSLIADALRDAANPSGEFDCAGLREMLVGKYAEAKGGSCGLDQLALAVIDHVLDDLGRPVGELAVLRDELVAGKLLVADFRLGIARDLGFFLAGQAILRGLESAERADHLRVEHDVRLVIGIEVDEGGLGHAELVGVQTRDVLKRLKRVGEVGSECCGFLGSDDIAGL